MGFNCGIVGLPNVGKSTLFNALTATAAAQAANYPFCTIEPNVGRVPVPDTRLTTLAVIGKSAKVVPTTLEFVDIAGLVRGASKGEGLGNQFLAHIREVDAIIHVLRCFEDPDIAHVEGAIDPLRDAEVVETELMLADLDSLEKRLFAAHKRARGNDKEAIASVALMEPLVVALREGRPVRAVIRPEQAEAVKRLQLLTSKPVLYLCNVEESAAAAGNAFTERVVEHARAEGARVVVVSAAIEAEVAQLPEADRAEFLEGLGLHDSGLDRVIRAGYDLLGLLTFFTVGPKEAHAWTVVRGTKAPQAAGTIHGDFERGFIASETISYDDYLACKGEAGAKDAGKMRVEGKEYVVKDGDILLFRFNV
ncbi:MAG TPA: redox-regulated ATPase YchF [Acetobacteraceae bacterium]|jgi:GTP-binding protein YchF|nr:redox-regulated ATPase YchF [Acetobacteraceae bacterium]